MVREGDTAPDFTVPMAQASVEQSATSPETESRDDVGSFTLSEHVGDGPIVLAFFPGAFTSVCEEELCSFRDALADFEALDARVYGVSVDTPFSQNAFRAQNDLTFPLLSDFDKEVIEAYDVVLEELAGLHGLAKRSVFVIDDAGEVAYSWVSDDPGVLPDLDEVRDAVERAS